MIKFTLNGKMFISGIIIFLLLQFFVVIIDTIYYVLQKWLIVGTNLNICLTSLQTLTFWYTSVCSGSNGSFWHNFKSSGTFQYFLVQIVTFTFKKKYAFWCKFVIFLQVFQFFQQKNVYSRRYYVKNCDFLVHKSSFLVQM